MSSYTMTLSEVIDFLGVSATNTKDKIEQGRLKLFNFEYPIFDSNYKKVFETNFIRHFYMREIGFETEGLFLFQLETWLLINMPYFNKMFESELLTFDPLSNTKLETSHSKSNDRTQNQTSNTTGTNTNDVTQTGSGTSTDDDFSRHLTSNTPDSRLTITSEDGKGVIEYASSIEENTNNQSKTSNTTSTGNSTDHTNVDSAVNATINDTEDYLQSIVGKTGSQTYAKMIQEYRESFLRIERDIFKEMQQLFMLVY